MTGPGALVALTGPDGSRALVSGFGAHVTSWTTPDGREQLYLSERAILDGSAAIRGGIPVIFPQFAGEGPLPKHGFARTRAWRLLAGAHDGVLRTGTVPGITHSWKDAEGATATFEMTDTVETRDMWPYAFSARLTVTLRDRALEVALSVTNAGIDALSFTAALHTYLSMDDAFGAEVIGLEGLSHRDSISRVPGVQREPALAVRGAVNRVYADAPSKLEVRDRNRTVLVETTGFRDVVVWNPGSEGEADLGDMATGDARRMLCVEPAVIERPVVLSPGERWEAGQRLVAC